MKIFRSQVAETEYTKETKKEQWVKNEDQEIIIF